ncbi:putative duf572 domain-containing protein [Neofusicoccum parvum]|uniref:Duf572 domain-containing protein n=1 Tax=Neofusicoccum parvum TaxID=310453 RepID=A0ACB5SJT1_9PEZI|nr:putative duf572 domain-containing protein [Neofusicoccum parvum]
MQGFNMGRYYAPSTTSAPTFNAGTHPLGARARKLASAGVLVVRFEMPFAVWCDTCRPAAIIGQGVRFNAEKRKVGMYHSTPVWEFALKHAACGGRIVVRTDPRVADYVVESGGRKRDYGERGMFEGVEGLEDGEELLTPEERERRKEDAMAALEGRKGEKEKKRREEDRVEELRQAREKDWADPYAANKKLRRPFRERRKEWRKEEGVKEELQDRFGLGLEIVEEREEDRRRAKLIEFGVDAADEDVEAAALKAAARPLFGDEAPKSAVLAQTVKGKTRAGRAAETRKTLLQQKLKGNTRAAMDPFSVEKTQNGPRIFTGIKRKRITKDDGSNDDNSGDTTPQESLPQDSKPPPDKRVATLVDYDSDDD